MSKWASLITDLRSGPSRMTLSEIGSEIGITPQGVCDIEKGRSKSPGVDVALALIELHKKRLPERSTTTGTHG